MTIGCALLNHCIDYAGLFPPAGLDLPTTVRNDASYRAGTDQWAAGRLILPAEMAKDAFLRWPELIARTPLSILIGAEIERDVATIKDAGIIGDVFECKLLAEDQIDRLLRLVPDSARVFFEISTSSDPESLIHAVASAGAGAKIRTGGITAEMIPSAGEVARFLLCCVQQGVFLKATAGLHHPFSGVYPLTYETDSASGRMFGFVNVILASVVLLRSKDLQSACEMLSDANASSFAFQPDRITWRGQSFTADEIAHARGAGLHSFGSCSFEEPLAGLRAVGAIA